MGEQKSIFQLVVLGIFIVAIIGAVFAFASYSGGGGQRDIGNVVMWGTLNAESIDAFLRAYRDTDNRVDRIFYEQIPEEQFSQRLAEGLADGSGPDVYLLSQDNIIRDWTKVVPISYAEFSERAYKDTFIDEAEMYLGQDGIRAIPAVLDPMVMYWNRDILAEAGFAKPPQYWDEFVTYAERITVRDKANNVLRATIALGEYDNVAHAKDILALLIMQAGGSIVSRTEDGALVADLAITTTQTVTPAQTALRFFTQFSNPVKTVYTWNRSLANSRDLFAQGKLALYIGYASEAFLLQEQNPHLNYDVAPVPQVRAGDGTRRLTFGRMYAFATPKAAQNLYGGREVAFMLSSKDASALLADTLVMQSPRRDVLSETPSDPATLVFRNAALLSRAWFDPHPQETARIFRYMVGDVTSGALRLSDAVVNAQKQLDDLLSK